jgi:outer membrane protein assembly factor BamD (BamD/ComL family)
MNNKIYFKNLFIKNYQSVLITFLMIFNLNFASAQDLDIATEYFKAKEYTKAKAAFEKLTKNEDLANQVHYDYIQTLIQLKDWKAAEKFLKKQIKSNKGNSRYIADFGDLYLLQEKTKEAKIELDKAIELAKISENEAQLLANHLIQTSKIEEAIAVLLQSRAHFNNPLLYGNTLGKLFKRTGNTEMMINEYLIYAQNNSNLDYFKTIIQDEIKTEKEQVILERVLYESVQKYPDIPFYTEVLISYLVNQKLFYKAFLQAKALDKRMKYDGSNVYELAFVARQNKDWANAAKMFEYMAKEYPKNQEYPAVRRLLVNCKEEMIKTMYPVDNIEIKKLIVDYKKLLEEVGLNQRTFEAMKSMANLYAFYLHEPDSAQAVLEKAIKLASSDMNFVNRCKLDLGDIQLLAGFFWEATLTYQQVEKAEKDNPIGYEAKLKNAKLNYFKGDFEVAEDILNILKKATTREIANDAMDLSLLIRDNTGMDSTETAMKCYAAAELNIFQNKFGTAVDSLTRIISNYKNDGLADEALFKRANCYLKTGKNDLAVADLNKIIEDFPVDVLGDDATYLLAITYQEKLNEANKAMKLFETLMKNYPGSIYVVDARNRFRALRGDTIN